MSFIPLGLFAGFLAGVFMILVGPALMFPTLANPLMFTGVLFILSLIFSVALHLTFKILVGR